MIPDLSAIFYLAIFGAICGVLALLGGAGLLTWLVIVHVRII